jgi:hypothetical protein
MTKVVLLYRTNLPYGVKPSPWHVWANGLSKPLENLQLLLLTEQKFASGQTLKLKDALGFSSPSCSLICLDIRSNLEVFYSLSRLESQTLVPSWMSVCTIMDPSAIFTAGTPLTTYSSSFM